MESCLSGLKSRTRNAVYASAYRGFESLTFRWSEKLGIKKEAEGLTFWLCKCGGYWELAHKYSPCLCKQEKEVLQASPFLITGFELQNGAFGTKVGITSKLRLRVIPNTSANVADYLCPYFWNKTHIFCPYFWFRGVFWKILALFCPYFWKNKYICVIKTCNIWHTTKDISMSNWHSGRNLQTASLF